MSLVTSTDGNAFFEVPEDGTYIRRDGGSFWYPAGHRLTVAEAALFEAFDAPLPPVSGGEERQEPEPENRMEPAPENRAAKKK